MAQKIEIRGPIQSRLEEVLSPPALEFLGI
jgi:hypothetical protein